MKILVVCQYYYPEPFRITDICEELVKSGHEVTVITGIPNYPSGKIYKNYRNRKNKNEIINGVKIHRCFTVPRRSGAIFRILNYFSYSFSSSIFAWKFKEEYDVVFVNQLSPVMMANAAICYKNKHNKKIILYCLDLWPESLSVGGIKKSSNLYKFFHKLSKSIYTKVDKIVVTSESFIKYFNSEFNIKEIEYLPQYAESYFIPESCLKPKNDTVDLMFAGNIGAAQSIETIIFAAKETLDIPNLKWHIVGDGSEILNIKKLAEENGVFSVIFHGRQEVNDMPKYYSMADAMLVTMQKNPELSMTLPGKVQTYMAASKPIIAAIDGEASKVIKNADCGLCVPAEDYIALADAVRQFIKTDYIHFAKNSYNYYNKYFKKENFLSKLENILENTINEI